jgi:hypothetical protein
MGQKEASHLVQEQPIHQGSWAGDKVDIDVGCRKRSDAADGLVNMRGLVEADDKMGQSIGYRCGTGDLCAGIEWVG